MDAAELLCQTELGNLSESLCGLFRNLYIMFLNAFNNACVNPSHVHM